MSYRNKQPDLSLLTLNSEEREFFGAIFGETNEQALKEHIVPIQRKACEILPFPCIQRFEFTKPKIAQMPSYPYIMMLGQEQPDAILLDLGCCLGTDVRKAVLDGFPAEQVLAVDREKRFWDLGHELFYSTPDSFTVPFIQGDAFNDDFLSVRPLSDYSLPPPPPLEDLKDLSSLLPLQGHISAIHVSSVFELYGEDKQTNLAHRLAGLLKPAPGSIIFGSHGGMPGKGIGGLVEGGHAMFCHSPESWIELWDGEIFPKGCVEVNASLEPIEDKFSHLFYAGHGLLVWSVKFVEGLEDTD